LAGHPAVAIALDPSVTYQRIDGFGGSAANESELRAMPEPDRSEVLDLVFADLEPSVVRIKPRPAMEPANYDADPAHANAAPTDMPLWMTGFSNTTHQGYGSPDEGIWQADLIHESLVNGVSMYVMWNLYRPGGPGEAAIVIPTTRGAHGYTVTPKYWTLRQYAKYVRAGSVRIDASNGDADLLVTAFRDDAAGKLVAVAINRATAPRWAVFNGAGFGGAPEVVRTSELESGTAVSPESVDRLADRSLLMPARSVATLSWDLDP
jgi:O-glycosyl hydrolase